MRCWHVLPSSWSSLRSGALALGITVQGNASWSCARRVHSQDLRVSSIQLLTRKTCSSLHCTAAGLLHPGSFRFERESSCHTAKSSAMTLDPMTPTLRTPLFMIKVSNVSTLHLPVVHTIRLTAWLPFLAAPASLHAHFDFHPTSAPWVDRPSYHLVPQPQGRVQDGVVGAKRWRP